MWHEFSFEDKSRTPLLHRRQRYHFRVLELTGWSDATDYGFNSDILRLQAGKIDNSLHGN